MYNYANNEHWPREQQQQSQIRKHKEKKILQGNSLVLSCHDDDDD